MVQTKYCDRSGRIVTLTYEQLAELDRLKSTTVETGGIDVELYVDGFESTAAIETDVSLALGPGAPDALWSGFPARFYSVLDEYTEGDGDVIFIAEDRPERQFAMEDTAGGLLSLGDELDRLERRHIGEELRRD